MVYGDTFIEKNSIILRNLNTNALNGANGNQYNVTGLTGYNFYSVPYETPLKRNNVYYQRFTYKFTTTNKTPTWCTFYLSGGSQGGAGTGTVSTGLTADQEYTPSGIVRIGDAVASTSGTLYQGPSSGTYGYQGVSGYVKNVMIYDVTQLQQHLIALGIIGTTDANLKTWCDSNLVWSPMKTPYVVTISDDSSTLFIRKGNMLANEYIEPDGLAVLYAANSTIRANPQRQYFDDSTLPCSIYNNKGNGTVTLTRVDGAAQNSPFYPEHPYILKVTTSGEASPGRGGVIMSHTAVANNIFVERLIAKIPTGYNLTPAYNSQGTGASVQFVYPNAGSSSPGTGDWQEYVIKYVCGTEGSFSSGGHLYLSGGSSSTDVTWYIAYISSNNFTNHPEYVGLNLQPGRVSINKGVISTNSFNEVNEDAGFSLDAIRSLTLPSGWTIDESDYPSGSKTKFSISQAYNAAAYLLPIRIPINSRGKYEVTVWIKGKNDMTSYLFAVPFYQDSTIYSHAGTIFVPSTMTTLAAQLNTGDTQVKVKNSANWVVKSYSGIGFRSNTSGYDRNNVGQQMGSSDGLIASVVDASTVSLRTAYTGANVASGRAICESYSGAGYFYPIGKGNLPTDNTWKKLTFYIGNGTSGVTWIGSSSNGWTYSSSPATSYIPRNANYMQFYLNLYANTSTSQTPLKFADIEIRNVVSNLSGYSGAREYNNIQIKGTLDYS